MGFFFLFYTLVCFFKYETIVRKNGSSLGDSEQDTFSVTTANEYVKRFLELWVGIHAAIRSNEYQEGFLEL